MCIYVTYLIIQIVYFGRLIKRREMLSKSLDCADHRTKIVEGAIVSMVQFLSDRATRYMQDGSILPRISTSCDLQRRITKPPKSIVPWSRVPAFTSLIACIFRKNRYPDLARKGAVVKRLSRKKKKIDAKGSAQTNLDLEYTCYSGSYGSR